MAYNTGLQIKLLKRTMLTSKSIHEVRDWGFSITPQLHRKRNQHKISWSLTPGLRRQSQSRTEWMRPGGTLGAVTWWAGPLWPLASSLVGEGCQSSPLKAAAQQGPSPREAHGPLSPLQPVGMTMAINQRHYHHLLKALTMNPSGLVLC